MSDKLTIIWNILRTYVTNNLKEWVNGGFLLIKRRTTLHHLPAVMQTHNHWLLQAVMAPCSKLHWCLIWRSATCLREPMRRHIHPSLHQSDGCPVHHSAWYTTKPQHCRNWTVVSGIPLKWLKTDTTVLLYMHVKTNCFHSDTKDIYGRGKRVPKCYSGCCSCCYHFSKNP